MPNIVNGSVEGYLDAGFLQTSYEYDYPTVEDRELDLRPGKSKLHRKLVDEVMKKARASHSVISNRFDSWREIDKLLVTYIRPDEEEQKVKETDDRRPTSIVFPYSYAVLETLLTYLSDVFLDDPIFRYEGSSPEDTVGAILLELVVQKHCQKHKVGLALHTQWRDALAYGIGPVSPAWDVRTGTRRVMRQSGGFSGFAERLMGREPVAEEEIAVLFEGNVLRNIDPYNLLPDPSVSAHNIQKGEFIGWIEQTNLTGLLRQEATDEDYFNCRYLKHLKGRRVDLGRNQSSRDIKHQISPDAMSGNLDLLEVVHMYIDLIPRDWELGSSEYPEKWLFSVAAGEVVVQARPLNLNHGMFPVSIAAPDYDGYSIAPLSKLETQYGLQHTLNFLFNSHVANVRKAINDMLIVDPYMINIKDLQNPGPGKLIRMRRPAWGRGVRDAVMQLNITDITQQNISSGSWIINWMNNIVGIDESLMGSMRQGGPERLTKAEFQGTRQSAMTRLAHMAKVISMQSMQDIGYFFGSHTQQLMSEDTYVNTIGEWEDRLKKEFGLAEQQDSRMKVRPEDLLIDFDVEIKDGAHPSTKSSDFWMAMITLLMENPEMNQFFDIRRIFKHAARQNGVKNVSEFYRVQPDEQVMREVEKGNLIPQQQQTAGGPSVSM